MNKPSDPIIEELHATRREIAARFDYDVRRISEDAKRRQAIEGKPLWTPPCSPEAVQETGENKGVRNLFH